MKKKKVILKISLILFLLLIIASSLYAFHCYRVINRAGNLKGLCLAFQCYANDNNDCLPDASQWTDLLIEQDILWPEYLEDGQTRYAMNINASGMNLNNLPKDMVLLFEAKGPKNLCGGPELIQSQKYWWLGCAVQFGFICDNIKFVRKEEVENLRWEP